MLVKRARRKLPRNAVESLMNMCERLSEEWDKPATGIFKRYLELMNKYADYFFSKPWPEKYDYAEATTFTDEDMDFLFEGKNSESFDRYTTICLKKNINMELGFMGCVGMSWTQQAFHNRFFRPEYKPVQEAFLGFPQESEDARSVLNKLKEQFSDGLIHDSLVDFFEADCPSGYPYERERLIEEMLELLHTVEGVPSCRKWRCSWYMNQKYGTSSASGKSLRKDTSGGEE
jgi:hypothetical protein